MDGITFDTLARVVFAASCRRDLGRALAGLALGAGPGFGRLSAAEAGERQKKRRRKRRRKNRAHICQGRNACISPLTSACNPSDGNCFCFVDAAGEPICARGNTVASCEQCEQQFPGRLCFPGTGPQCSGFSCVVKCDV